MDESFFIAVCKDRPDDPDGFWYTVYFINNTVHNIEVLSYETGGFVTIDDELVRKLGPDPHTDKILTY